MNKYTKLALATSWITICFFIVAVIVEYDKKFDILKTQLRINIPSEILNATICTIACFCVFSGAIAGFIVLNTLEEKPKIAGGTDGNKKTE